MGANFYPLVSSFKLRCPESIGINGLGDMSKFLSQEIQKVAFISLKMCEIEKNVKLKWYKFYIIIQPWTRKNLSRLMTSVRNLSCIIFELVARLGALWSNFGSILRLLPPINNFNHCALHSRPNLKYLESLNSNFPLFEATAQFLNFNYNHLFFVASYCKA